LLPFLLLVLVVVSRVGGEALAEDLLLAMAGYLTPDFRQVLVRAATNATRSTGLSVVGVSVLVWGALRIFRGLDQAFSDIYESESLNTVTDQLVDAIVVFGAIGLAIFVVSLADELLGFSVGPYAVVVRPLASVAGISLALLPMYYVFPDEDVSVREIVPGAVVAGGSWTALSLAFGLYVETSSATEYGVVGVIILLITWLYFAGFVLLVGASVNAVLAGRSEDVTDIAWQGGKPTANDAAFVAPLRDLEAADWDGEVRVTVGDTDVRLPAPEDAGVEAATIERPRLLGGSREHGRVVLTWSSQSGERE
jgi:membrane protein